jgi:hypothetical protein
MVFPRGIVSKRLVREWQDKREHGVSWLGAKFNRSIHAQRQLPCNREPQAAARGLATVCAVEALEEVLAVTLGHSGAAVVDG